MPPIEPVAEWRTDWILVVRDLYTPAECRALIDAAGALGFEPADVRTRSGPEMRPEIRTNDRAGCENPAIADELWSRIRPHLPEAPDGRAVGVDQSLRFYRYAGAQQFKRHKDGVSVGPDGERSRYSYLLYLNDDFEGGETRFTFVTKESGERRQETLDVRPETGSALLFIHDQWHEGRPVEGGTKYVLRTDVLYRDSDPSMTL
ncbi:prolyl hydroxylase family protein [Alienimonas chondri]|uniref:Fe2OG dioxygenase domain-containing protein n=1 Tax=Alienimonas chondri TaxID=2681879 RepID=A0ABX1VH75_9PLAN|nr:2OG-Fe(II) oxygenase [Alienimonas chondri]NNJ27462.1 hypothetical protein [Alienimonas chondri]